MIEVGKPTQLLPDEVIFVRFSADEFAIVHGKDVVVEIVDTKGEKNE